MQYRTIIDTDLQVSAVGLGCNNFGMRCDQTGSLEVIHAALDAGINFFDTADIYGGRGRSEEFIGEALKGLDRSQLIIATKFANPMSDDDSKRGASRRYIFEAVEASLRRLGTDYIDLYQQHVPDPHTPIEETLSALDELVKQGKVRYLGNSNFSGWQIADADWTARQGQFNRFVTAQNQYSLLERDIEREILPACEHFRLHMLPYFPLASGMLTGKYQRGEPPAQGTRMANFGGRAERAMSDANFDRIDRLTNYAQQAGHTLLELAMSWLASHPAIPSVIAGATTPAQVHSNAAAADWLLSASERKEIAALTRRSAN